MKILTWNVRGIGSSQKRVQIKHVISDYAPDFVCLSETKMLNVNNKLVKSIWSSIDIKFLFKQVIGRLGGILIMWDNLKHQLINSIIGEFTISTILLNQTITTGGSLQFMALLTEIEGKHFSKN